MTKPPQRSSIIFAAVYITLQLNSPLVGAPPHERRRLVVAEERLHLVVLFQLRIHDDGVDASFDAVLV